MNIADRAEYTSIWIIIPDEDEPGTFDAVSSALLLLNGRITGDILVRDHFPSCLFDLKGYFKALRQGLVLSVHSKEEVDLEELKKLPLPENLLRAIEFCPNRTKTLLSYVFQNFLQVQVNAGKKIDVPYCLEHIMRTLNTDLLWTRVLACDKFDNLDDLEDGWIDHGALPGEV
jgi:hypothetical protein